MCDCDQSHTITAHPSTDIQYKCEKLVLSRRTVDGERGKKMTAAFSAEFTGAVVCCLALTNSWSVFYNQLTDLSAYGSSEVGGRISRCFAVCTVSETCCRNCSVSCSYLKTIMYMSKEQCCYLKLACVLGTKCIILHSNLWPCCLKLAMQSKSSHVV